MAIRFCRDCVNFEDRRDIDEAALCKKNMGPYVCCEDFEYRDGSLNSGRLYYKFCAECVNFEDVNGTPICAKNHIVGVACQEFRSRFEKLKATRHNNHAITALVMHATKEGFNPEVTPVFLIAVGRKIKW